MPLFEVVILERPKKKDAEDGKFERLVVGPVTLVSSDIKAAALTVVMDNADMKIDKARMEVLTRPFV